MSESLSAGAVSGGLDQHVAEMVAEITDRLHAGEPVDVGEYIVRHPELADRLRPLVAALDLLARFSSSAGTQGPLKGFGAGEEMSSTLGDFRILREVGRGGMGIVYEAEQLSLGRRMALKVLPFGAMMDQRQLQRFHTEARAAAGLHHSNIVPVFAVGSERGVHYYAMQFIEGRTLAELIDEQRGGNRSQILAGREPAAASASTAPVAAQATSAAPRDAASFRRLAEWAIQAAEALDYAHALGVVHRDVKPANLLVDTASRLWVTDFGLAQVQSDPRLTMTGDLVGTLRYMSPEQALAQRPLIDHRTDIYSLGATLYELLTLHPALDGLERRELLRQIEFEEPRLPRRHNPAVPPELELIVLKALEKDPTHRYGTAKEFADDLRCFLDDRPLHARRPTWWQLAAKWTRRHRAVVRAFSVGLILAVVALGVSTWLVWRAYRAEAEQRQLADTQYRRAREQRRQARQAVDTMYLDVAQNWIDRQPGASELQKQFLEKVLRYYQAFAEDEEEDEEARFDRAIAYVRVGRILNLSLAREEQAQAPLRKANALLEELARQHPDKGSYTLRLAEAKVVLAFSKVEDRRQLLEQAVSLLEGLVARCPAEPEYRCALALRLTNLGMDLTMSGRQKEGGALCRRAIALLEDLVRSSSPIADYYMNLANAAENLAESEQQAGNWIEAADSFRKAAAAFAHLTPDVSGVPEYQHGLLPFYWHNLGEDYRNLGIVLGHLQRLEEAEAAFTRAEQIHAKLVADFPDVGHYWRALLRDYRDKGAMLWARGRSREAEQAFAQTLEIGDRMAVRLPPDVSSELAEFLVTCPDPKRRNAQRARDLAIKITVSNVRMVEGWRALGIADYQLGDYAGAIAAFERGMSLQNDDPLTEQFFMAMAHWRLGHKQQARQWFEKAATSMNAAERRDDDLIRFRAEASALLGITDSPSSTSDK